MSFQKKIINLKILKQQAARLRRQGKKIAFTNGCFDLLHYGHICYLTKAKKKNRILVLGVNSDDSVKRIKGGGRPINPQSARAAILAALECVDYVTIFKENNPYNLIKNLKPDILIKGADWKYKEVLGSDLVKSTGGKIEFISYDPRFSTTKMIQKIIRSENAS